ncbi:type II secretion system F family protein [Candidatus Poriferisodalis sp.]|uniref:type II secretion system F family protein n=1 Tax=Candidatus Poriferisodalis sp. TaxID=3101277 RepID=UPI003B52B51B
MPSDVLIAVVFGVLFTGGLGAVAVSRPLSRSGSQERHAASAAAGVRARRAPVPAPRSDSGARLNSVRVVQIIAATAGGAVGWFATGLAGMAMLLGGLGVLLPPFMAAPARRRRQTRIALAWSLWSRQLAELARAGSGLSDSLTGSVDHAPVEIRPTVERVSASAALNGLPAALEELSQMGTVWEPEVAAGLRMAAMSGGSVADPLLDLCGRIGDVVDLHRAKTEAVVQLWTQTIALLGLAGGVVTLMYRNNPAYFEPYAQGTGQLVFVGISGMLLMSTGFLVFHSVVREQNSVLVAPKRRNRAKDPL